MAADLGRIAVGSSSLDECPAGERIAGFGNGPLAAACATGVLTGRKAQRAHELAGVLEPSQVAEFGDEGDGHGALDATHRLEDLHDGGERPALDLLPEFRLQALESVVMCSEGSPILLEDDLLGGCGTDHFRQPAQMGRPPRGPARIPNMG
jgi:hypothetical protein